MSWFDEVADWTAARASGVVQRLQNVRVAKDARYPQQDRVPTSYRTLSSVPITPDTAVTIPAVWACLRYLSQTVAVLPWHVVLETMKGLEVQRSHQVDYLLNERVSAEWSSFQFRETMVHWALRWGNGYAEIERDTRGRPIALWPIHPERVKVCRDPDTGVLFYEVDHKLEFKFEDIFHLRGFGEGPVGVNVIAYAAESLGWAKAAQLFGAAFFGNGMNVNAVVKVKKELSIPAFKKLKEELAGLYKGVRNANRTAILDQDMEWEQVSVDPNKAQFILTNQHLVEETCRWFGVPPHKIMHLLRGTFCLPASAKVFTVDGPKRIAEVKVGDLVWSRGDSGWVQSTVDKSGPTGVDCILKLTTTNRTLRLNAKHRVLVRRAHEVPLGSGQTGGRNVRGKKVRLEWRNVYVAAGDLVVGDVLITLDVLPDVGCMVAPNGRDLTPGFMSFCGLLIGDGNVFASGSVAIARASSASYMDHYREIMKREFTAGGRLMRGGEDHPGARLTTLYVDEIRASLDQGEPRKDLATEFDVSISTINAIAQGRNWAKRIPSPVRPIHLGEKSRSTNFRSMAASDELADLGFGGTSRTKRVPGWVYNLSEDLRLAFLAGYLDADGSIDKLGRMTFGSVSADLADDVRYLCMGLGIPVTNSYRKKVVTKLPNGTRFEGEISVFNCSDPGRNRRVPSATPSYAQRMNDGTPFGRKDRAYPRHGGPTFSEEGCGLSRVVEITEEPAEVVYDLSVGGTHNFIADGVVVHNSNIEHQSIEVVVDSVSPWAKRLEDEANYKLFGGNRQGLKTKMYLQALMRGDTAARGTWYKMMREVGAFSVNDILRLEDQNTIGPVGDKRVMNQAYTTLERIGEEPVEPVAASPDPEEPEDDDDASEEDDDAEEEIVNLTLELNLEEVINDG